jgi:hypothetical protein
MTNVKPGNGLRIVDSLAEMYDATFDLHLSGAGIEAVLLLPIERISFDQPEITGRFAAGITEHVK